MSKRKWNRKNTAGLLAAALLLVGIAAVPGYAAEWNGRSVDDASLTLSLGADSEYREDLSGAAWNVAVYRIASYASQGSCVAEEGFEDVTDAINASESLTAEEAEEPLLQELFLELAEEEAGHSRLLRRLLEREVAGAAR